MNIVLNYKRPAVPLTAKHTYAISAPITLPETFDISSYGPPIFNQKAIGSCVENAILRCAWYALKRHKGLISHPMDPNERLSRAFLYANARILSNEPITQDTGSTIHAGYDALETDLTVDETAYPYVKANFFVKPPQAIYDLAKKTFHKCVGVDVPQNLYAIKHAIFYGRPVTFGADVYSSFMVQKTMDTGIIPMPDTKAETLEGGHAICLVGWDDAAQTFLMANSWGTSVGLPTKRGYFTMPYSYIEDPTLCSEFMITEIFY